MSKILLSLSTLSAAIAAEPFVPWKDLYASNETQSITSDAPTLGFFFRSMDIPTDVSYPLNEPSSWLDNVVHYRNVPGVFPEDMDYFFDGLATIVKFSFKDGQLNINSKGFESKAYEVLQ